MDHSDLTRAYESLLAGDPDPLVALMAPTLRWRGRRHLRRPLRVPG